MKESYTYLLSLFLLLLSLFLYLKTRKIGSVFIQIYHAEVGYLRKIPVSRQAF